MNKKPISINRGHGGKMDRKMGPLIEALLTEPTYEAAARKAGVGVNTVARWLRDPKFRQQYENARHEAFGKSLSRLQQASDLAVDTVVKVLKDAKQTSAARLRAAVIVLSYGAKINLPEMLQTFEKISAPKTR